MSIYLSGIQPTGKLHIGNYFGCIKPFLSIKTNSLNRNNKNIFLIADMHCYTKPKRISNVSNQVFEAVRSLLAAGVNPETTIFVRQSRVLEHANLAWYLSCLTKYSRAENMTQFKSNTSNHPNVGLFMYPILQAADILIYSPEYVLVGPDQKQHLELAAELCLRANRFSISSIFKKPNILSNPLRIMGIKDGEHKMSKSEPDGCLFLTDEPEEIKKKVLKARTDGIDGIDYDLKKRKSLSNLIQILALVRNTPGMALAEELSHLDHLQFKMILADELAKYFMNYRERYKSIDKIEVEDVLEVGTLAASKIASSKLQQYVSIYNK